jgi:hypothetical protein
MLKHLRSGDNIGITLFDDNSVTLLPIGPAPIGDGAVGKLQRLLKPVAVRGGTNFEAGYKGAMEVISKVAKASDPTKVESRIIVLTDDMPNLGDTNPQSLGVCIMLGYWRSKYVIFF